MQQQFQAIRQLAVFLCIILGVATERAFADYSFPSETVSSDVIAHPGVATNFMWNAHLPRYSSDGHWSYFMLTNMADISGNTYRSAFLFKKKVPDGQWEYSGLGMVNVHQPVGLLFDIAGRLHLAFDCLAGGPCWGSSFHSYGLQSRFFDIIFTKRNEDGSVKFSSGVKNYNEFASWESGGYMSIGTDPSRDLTFASVATTGGYQSRFQVGTYTPNLKAVPRVSGANTKALYPQVIFSPAGAQFYAHSEIVPNWQQISNLAYSHVALHKSVDGNFVELFSDSVSNPNGTTRYVFYSDSSFDSEGNLYFLYLRKNDQGVGEPCSYIVKISPDDHVSLPQAAGCHSLYAQLQVDSTGAMFIFEEDKDSPRLRLSRSADGGATWREFVVEIPGMPEEAKGLQRPSLMKPWTAPHAYHPDFFQMAVGAGPLGGYSRYALEVRGYLLDDAPTPSPSPSPTPTISPDPTPIPPSPIPTMEATPTPTPLIHYGFEVIARPIRSLSMRQNRPIVVRIPFLISNSAVLGRQPRFIASIEGARPRSVILQRRRRRALTLSVRLTTPGVHQRTLTVTGPTGTVSIPILISVHARR